MTTITQGNIFAPLDRSGSLNQGSNKKKSQKKDWKTEQQENLGSGKDFEIVGKHEKAKTPLKGSLSGKAACDAERVNISTPLSFLTNCVNILQRVNFETALGEQRSSLNQRNLDETALHSQIKHSTDWKGKEERYEPYHLAAKHTLDKQSGTGRGREVPKDGHGKGGWGNLEEEARLYKGVHADEAEWANSLQEAKEKGPLTEEDTTGTEDKATTLEEYQAMKRKSSLRDEVKNPEMSGQEISQKKKQSSENLFGFRVGEDAGLASADEPPGLKGFNQQLIINDEQFPSL